MVIKKSSVLLIVRTNVSAEPFSVGEIIGHYRRDGKWMTRDSTGKTWCNLISNLRNPHYFQYLSQYSMDDILNYLLGQDADLQTVCTERLEKAVYDTFLETQITSLPDIYKYIRCNLI